MSDRELSNAARQLEVEHAPDCGDCGVRMDLRGIQRNGNDTGWLVQWTCPECEPECVKLESGLPDGYEVVPTGPEDADQQTLTQAVPDGGTSGSERPTCPVCGASFDEKQKYGDGGTTQTTGFARVCHFIDNPDALTLTVYCHRRIPLEITTTGAETGDIEDTDSDRQGADAR